MDKCLNLIFQRVTDFWLLKLSMIRVSLNFYALFVELGYGEKGAGDGVVPPNATLEFTVELMSVRAPDEGLEVKVVEEGTDCSQKAAAGDTVSVHYTGTLKENGKQFDSSLDRGEPIKFPLGRGQVIKGWELGIKNMCVGEKRELVIPPALGYGSAGAGGVIPPNASLMFSVHLVSLEKGTGHSEL
jgi:FKBP-type peptidyl-prolyl cis-trans isomerase